MRKATYQDGWLAGQRDAREGKPKQPVHPGRQGTATAPVVFQGSARLMMGDNWADGYGHAYEAHRRMEPAPAGGGRDE